VTLLAGCGASPRASETPPATAERPFHAQLVPASPQASSAAETSTGEPALSATQAVAPSAAGAASSNPAEAGAEEAGPPAKAPEAASPRLPAESIQTVVHWNLGRFRGCYQEALLRYPGLEGRVAVRFVVDGGGNVADALVAEGDVPEPVSWCILNAFRQLRFPETDGGSIAVVYPFRLTRTGLVEAAGSSKPNAPTPRARRATGTAAVGGKSPAHARTGLDRLFALFLQGTSGDASTEQAVPAAGASAPGSTDSSARIDRAGGAAPGGGPGPRGQPACHPGDPLCSDIGR